MVGTLGGCAAASGTLETTQSSTSKQMAPTAPLLAALDCGQQCVAGSING
jgi:hypothetical protein